MTFVLHPLSHYNSITKPRVRFLLSLLEHLTIDFPSYFILSIIDMYRDTATRDKRIFPSAITRILCYFSVPFSSSDHFPVMCVIDYATSKRSEVQFQLRRSDTTTPPTPFAPSTFAPLSSMSGVTLKDIMVQLQPMDAHLDNLRDELCQENTHVGRIAWRQAEMGAYTMPSTPVAPADESDADDAADDDDDVDYDDEDDGIASSPSDDEMSTWHSYPLLLMTKRESGFDYESSHT